MDSYFRKRSGDGSDGSPPSEAWLFAQAVLGKPVPSASRAEADARARREHLEWLAAISPEDARRVRGRLSEEADAKAKQELLEWVAQVSGVREAQWDPSQHPRAPKGQPDGGQWVATGGSAGASTSPVTGASYSGPKKVVAQQVSWHPPVGHHWAPFGVVFRDDIRPLLSDDAVAYAMGAYSGPTDPAHGNGTYGGITHPQYNEKVNEELKKFIEARKIKKMTAKDMEEFIGLINNGLGANGQAHDAIAAFNKGIREALPKGPAPSSKMEHILAAGRKYMKTSRFRLLALGAAAAGLLGDMLQKHVDALDVAGESGHYRRAMRALEQGDVAKAHALLTGDRDSLYSELLVRVGFQAATNFRIAMDKVFEMAHEGASDFK
jgi:hypothetical protein